jgi:hypothetical protein
LSPCFGFLKVFFFGVVSFSFVWCSSYVGLGQILDAFLLFNFGCSSSCWCISKS